MQRDNNIRPIIVLGFDRSGTSVVASLVNQWGAYGGDSDMLRRSDIHNPSGFFEHEGLSSFFFSLSSSIHPDISLLKKDYEKTLRSKAKISKYVAPARKLIEEMNSHSRIWFWKEPLLSTHLAFWTSIWDEAVYVIAVRNPEESIRSCEKLYGKGYQSSGSINSIIDNCLYRISDGWLFDITRWQYYILSILRNLKDEQTKIFIRYEDLVDNPMMQCKRICNFLDACYGKPKSTADQRVLRMSDVVDSSLWRNRSFSSFDNYVHATTEQKSLYRLLVDLATIDSNLSFDEKLYPFPEQPLKRKIAFLALILIDGIVNLYYRARALCRVKSNTR